ncbi:MAG: phage Gp37/Gp68 family protein [Proteobacteria bacterium]|nr:phage Gp37/Gp68 family protein [Pseudomonadota bacterium]MBU1741454.1 phage Gp37/Gp68 family protein [Pseudomonadota bacterium]
MAIESNIEWTWSTWNPVTGCSPVSAGCDHCYARRMARRLQAMGQPRYKNGFQVTLHPDALKLPLTWRKPRLVFVNSMSDVFHQNVPTAFINQIFATMRRAGHHQFQILTKRSARLSRFRPEVGWPKNVWMGVTVERSDYIFRIDHLRRTGARTKFLSLEPLLGPLPDLDLTGIDWVILGGESGPQARPMPQTWVIDLKDQCLAAGVPFFFKQWGGRNRKKAGRMLLGQTWEQMPEAAGALRGQQRLAL